MAKRLTEILPQIGDVLEATATKGWYRSKQIWLQIVVLAATLTDYLVRYQGLEFSLDAASAEHFAIALAAIASIVVRLVTKAPVGIVKRRTPAHDENIGDA